MTAIRGSSVAITGAGAGIGRALALEAAARGAGRLVLFDRAPEALEDTRGAVARQGVRVDGGVVDVADAAALRSALGRFAEDAEGVDVLVNNAGHAVTGTFDEVPIEAFRHLLDVHLWGVVEGTHAVLPSMVRRNRGHVVNLSSVLGLIGVPWQTAYCTAKFAIRGFSESLRAELLVTGSAVKVSSVHPGGIATGIARAAAIFGDRLTPDEHARLFAKAARTPPERAARVILDGVERDRARILVGRDALAIDWLQRAQPEGYVTVAAGRLQRMLEAIERRRQRPAAPATPGQPGQT